MSDDATITLIISALDSHGKAMHEGLKEVKAEIAKTNIRFDDVVAIQAKTEERLKGGSGWMSEHKEEHKLKDKDTSDSIKSLNNSRTRVRAVIKSISWVSGISAACAAIIMAIKKSTEI